MVQGNYTSTRDKHTNIKIRKLWKKPVTNKCCHPGMGNFNKPSKGFSCKWSHLYNRRNIKIENEEVSRKQIEDFVVY